MPLGTVRLRSPQAAATTMGKQLGVGGEGEQTTDHRPQTSDLRFQKTDGTDGTKGKDRGDGGWAENSGQ